MTINYNPKNKPQQLWQQKAYQRTTFISIIIFPLSGIDVHLFPAINLTIKMRKRKLVNKKRSDNKNITRKKENEKRNPS